MLNIMRVKDSSNLKCFLLTFLNGFLLASLLYFYIEESYERKLFETLANYIHKHSEATTNKQEALLLNSLHLTYLLGKQRSSVFINSDFTSIKSSLIHPVTYDLMTSKGACGSYAFILSRLLNELNVPNRIIQMKVNGLNAGHILVEAKSTHGWVILDGMYDLCFKKGNGEMAGFAEVHNNWNRYRAQLPHNYNMSYNYEGARYTNWDKIPVLMPLIKWVITWTAGENVANHFSLRTYFLRKFHCLFMFTLCLYCILIFLQLKKYLKNKGRLHIKLQRNNSGTGKSVLKAQTSNEGLHWEGYEIITVPGSAERSC